MVRSVDDINGILRRLESTGPSREAHERRDDSIDDERGSGQFLRNPIGKS